MKPNVNVYITQFAKYQTWQVVATASGLEEAELRIDNAGDVELFTEKLNERYTCTYIPVKSLKGGEI